MLKNRLLPGHSSSDRLLPKKSTFVIGFRPQFLPLGASSPFVTPIFGYAYIRVSNNRQQLQESLNHKLINLIEANATKKTRIGFFGKLGRVEYYYYQWRI